MYSYVRTERNDEKGWMDGWGRRRHGLCPYTMLYTSVKQRDENVQRILAKFFYPKVEPCMCVQSYCGTYCNIFKKKVHILIKKYKILLAIPHIS